MAVEGSYHRDRPTTERHVSEHSGLHGIAVSNPAIQGSGIFVGEKTERLREPKAVDSKETLSSRHNRTGTHKNSQDCEYHPIQSQPRQNPSTEKAKRTKSHPKGEATCNGHLLRKGKSVFSNEGYWVCQLHSKAGPKPITSRSTQKTFSTCFLLCFCFCFSGFACLFSEKDRPYKLGRYGSGKEVRELEEERDSHLQHAAPRSLFFTLA